MFMKLEERLVTYFHYDKLSLFENEYFGVSFFEMIVSLSSQVTDWEGDEINLEEDQSERRLIFPAGGIVVSNGSLHHEILEKISSASSTL